MCGFYSLDDEDHEQFVAIASDYALSKYIDECLLKSCIKIYAVPNPRSDTQPLNSFFAYHQPADLPDIVNVFNRPLIKPVVNDKWLTTPCKLCEAKDWEGDRYTCLYCITLVLCSRCFSVGYHNHHPMLITRDLSAYSRKLIPMAWNLAATVPWTKSEPGPKIQLSKPSIEAAPAPAPAPATRKTFLPKKSEAFLGDV